MIPRREELVEATPPASPRSSTASSVSAYLHEHDFLSSPIRSPASEVSSAWERGQQRDGAGGAGGLRGGKMSARLRHAVGILLLLATVVLWTASNFLASVSCPYSELLIPSEMIWKDRKTG
jgi:solute carrier family 35 protein F5